MIDKKGPVATQKRQGFFIWCELLMLTFVVLF